MGLKWQHSRRNRDFLDAALPARGDDERQAPGSLNNISTLMELLLQEQDSGQHCSRISFERWILSVTVDWKQLPVRGAGGTEDVIETLIKDRDSAGIRQGSDPWGDKGLGSGRRMIPGVNRLPVFIAWRGEDLLYLKISADNLLDMDIGE